MYKMRFLIVPAFAISLTSCSDLESEAPGALPVLATESREDSAALAALNAKLGSAVASGDLSAIDAALSEGADVNNLTANKKSYLMLAVENNQAEVAEMLLSRGANPEEELLHTAAENGSDKVVGLLVDKGLDVSATQNKDTPLHVAATYGHTAVVTALLDQGADPEPPGKNQTTVLMLAAENGHLETIRVLLDFGVGLNDRNNEDLTALALARGNGHTAVVELLEAEGAEQ